MGSSATMTRGRPKGMTAAKSKAKKKLIKGFIKQKNQKEKKKNASFKTMLKEGSKDDQDDHHSDVDAKDKLPEEITEKDVKRSIKGRTAIRNLIRQMAKLDSQAFAANPVFSIEGGCRMKYEAAQEMSFDEAIDKAPACMELLSLKCKYKCYTLLYYVILKGPLISINSSFLTNTPPCIQ